MLRVFIYKDDFREELELAPGTVISISFTSPFFDKELNLGTQSLPFEFPWSERNRRILGAPEMIEGIGSASLQWYTCDLLDDDITEIAQGKLTILRNRGSFGYSTGTYVANITGGESRLGSLIKGKKLRDLALGGFVSWPVGTSSREFAETVMKNPPEFPFAFAPVKTMDFIDTGRSDYTTEYLAEDTVNNIVFNALAFSDGWTFGRVDPNNSNAIVSSGQAGYNDYRTVPYMNLHFVFRKVFEEHGYVVNGEWLDDNDFGSLYIYNNKAIDIPTPTNTDNNNFIYPPHHVPDMELPKFILALQNAFGFGIFLTGNREISIRYRNLGINPTQIIDVTRYVEDYFEDELTDIAAGGMQMSWDFGSGDSLTSDWVKNIDESRIIAQVDKYADVASLTFSIPPVTNDLIYIRAENYFLSYDASNSTWNYFSEYHDPIIIGDGRENPKPEVGPLLQAVSTDGYGNNTNYDMVGCGGPGTYYNYAGTIVENEYPFRIFYIKKVDTVTATGIPKSFSHNYSPLGVKRATTSLSLNSIDNIYDRLHKNYYQRLHDGRYYKVKILKSWVHRLNLSFLSGLQIKNVQYVLVDIEKDMGDENSFVTLKILPI